ncbi:MAG: 50S ribosomal protein L3 [Candidatus Parcubacteria bacterium]|nr:50S ribosomal protein L3 [Candidatus Parcubacteria bacterium]
MKFILGQKLGMSQIFTDNGKVVPVTLIEAGPCFITQIKNKEKDGYSAVQIGFGKTKNATKPETGHLKKNNLENLRYLREFRVDEAKIDDKEVKEGEKIDVSLFKEGEKVRVAGVSKGKGFAGVVKRWHFKGHPQTHGTKHETRTAGSVGGRFPQRVVLGRKMAGHLGAERVTVKNLKIAKVDIENNILAVKGAVPGRKGALLEISTKI